LLPGIAEDAIAGRRYPSLNPDLGPWAATKAIVVNRAEIRKDRVMSVVGLTLASGEPVYVNPDRVNRLNKAAFLASDSFTEVSFGHGDTVVVKGDMDYIAFQLFPDRVR
jgi:hypothetical protein